MIHCHIQKHDTIAASFSSLANILPTLQALNKKEHKNGMQSPDSPDNDAEYNTLTPRTEAKYNQIDEEFTLMMQRSQINGTKVGKLGNRENLKQSIATDSKAVCSALLTKFILK